MEREQTCRVTGERFLIDDWEQEFLNAISPRFDGELFPVPLPDLCPEERMRRRFALRNLRTLYRRTCPISGKRMLSPYDPEGPYLVYHPDVWWSDSWHGKDYGRDFDFSRKFFEQFADLWRAVPHLAYFQTANENCDYVNGAAHCKDCYLAFNMDYAEEILYSENVIRSRSCVDSLCLTECELCYECVDCSNCYHLIHGDRSVGCSESAFLQECRQCRNCIGCANLSNKQYYLFNEPATRDEYDAMWSSLSSRAALERLRIRAAAHLQQYPRRSYFGHTNEDVTGDCIHHAKNCLNCFEAFEIENCRHCYYLFNATNCVDVNIFGDHSEWLYNCQATGINCSHMLFCNFSWSSCSWDLYCSLIQHSSHCFGCASLRNSEYCILNKQYSKEEYERLAARIVRHMQETGEWGQFFPPEISPFPFPATQAAALWPLSRETAERAGYRWGVLPEKRVSQSALRPPDAIIGADVDICGQECACSESKLAYQITRRELELHRRLGVALSDLAPETRYARRLSRKNRPKLWRRQCSRSGETLETTYPAGAQIEIVSETVWRQLVD